MALQILSAAITMTLLGSLASAVNLPPQTCSAPDCRPPWDYSQVLAPHHGISIPLAELPGFTRSVYERSHALITPESRVWAGQVGWINTLTCHLTSPGAGRAAFSMYLANMSTDAMAPGTPADDVERFVLVLDGEVHVTRDTDQGLLNLTSNHYAYFPAGSVFRMSSSKGAGLLIWERRYAAKGNPTFQHGFVDDAPILPVAGEVFELRKLLPQTTDYDFNIHVMDFQPGEYLNVKEIHYNQHGLMMLEGRGIYRLADKWYPVQAGDAIWMSPYVIQWYAALGTSRTRYVINKDTVLDPLLH